jgi:hypothetical protein
MKISRNFRKKTQLGTDYRIQGRRIVTNNNIQIIKLSENGVEYK